MAPSSESNRAMRGAALLADLKGVAGATMVLGGVTRAETRGAKRKVLLTALLIVADTFMLDSSPRIPSCWILRL